MYTRDLGWHRPSVPKEGMVNEDQWLPEVLIAFPQAFVSLDNMVLCRLPQQPLLSANDVVA